MLKISSKHCSCTIQKTHRRRISTRSYTQTALTPKRNHWNWARHFSLTFYYTPNDSRSEPLLWVRNDFIRDIRNMKHIHSMKWEIVREINFSIQMELNNFGNVFILLNFKLSFRLHSLFAHVKCGLVSLWRVCISNCYLPKLFSW